jgi:hypothetical protein
LLSAIFLTRAESLVCDAWLARNCNRVLLADRRRRSVSRRLNRR